MNPMKHAPRLVTTAFATRCAPRVRPATSTTKLHGSIWLHRVAQTHQRWSSSQQQTENDKTSRQIEEAKEKQARKPWIREGSDQPPVARNRSAGAMTKGKTLELLSASSSS